MNVYICFCIGKTETCDLRTVFCACLHLTLEQGEFESPKCLGREIETTNQLAQLVEQ